MSYIESKSGNPLTVGELKAFLASVDDATPISVIGMNEVNRLIYAGIQAVESELLVDDPKEENLPETVQALVFS